MKQSLGAEPTKLVQFYVKEEEKKDSSKQKTPQDAAKRKVDYAAKTLSVKKKPLPIAAPSPNLKKVTLSHEFKAQNIILTEDNMVAQGHKGFLSIMSNYPIIEGCYYYELKILPPKTPLAYETQSPHVRVGIGVKEFKCEYVLGFDNKSYSYRDTDGSVFHEGESKKYGEPYGIDDTIGCMVYLKPPKPKSILQEVPEDEKKFEEINHGSKIFFFKNGVCEGLAFEKLIQGFYYMGVSLYNHARVRFNFGPMFEFQPIPPANSEFEDIIKHMNPASSLNEEENRYKEVKIF